MLEIITTCDGIYIHYFTCKKQVGQFFTHHGLRINFI